MSNFKCQISNSNPVSNKHWKLQIGNCKLEIPFPGGAGFTLVELLISFAVIGVLAAISTVSFVTYNQSQSLSNAAKDIEQMLSVAKSRAQSQVKPPTCEGSLMGYVFRTCGGVVSCATAGDYEVVSVCKDQNGENKDVVSIPPPGAPAKKLPRGVSFAESSKGLSFEFLLLTGGVTHTADIVLSGPNNASKTITVDSQGNIDQSE